MSITITNLLLAVVIGAFVLALVTAFVTWVAWMTVQDLNDGKERRAAKRVVPRP